jgi:hypothetical protein
VGLPETLRLQPGESHRVDARRARLSARSLLRHLARQEVFASTQTLSNVGFLGFGSNE